MLKAIASGGTRQKRRAADSAERAYSALRQQLVEFKIRPDERINEVHVAQTLKLSRTPVREALNRLAIEGFVVLRPNKGYFFRGPDIDDLIDLFEFRSIVETGSFLLACERAEDTVITRLRSFWTDARKRYERGNPDEILELDEGFHVRLAEAAKNPELVRQLEYLNARIRFVRRIQIENVAVRGTMISDHTAIVKALADRDAARGVEILRGHISLTINDARSMLKDALLKVYVPDSLWGSRRRTGARGA